MCVCVYRFCGCLAFTLHLYRYNVHIRTKLSQMVYKCFTIYHIKTFLPSKSRYQSNLEMIQSKKNRVETRETLSQQFLFIDDKKRIRKKKYETSTKIANIY